MNYDGFQIESFEAKSCGHARIRRAIWSLSLSMVLFPALRSASVVQSDAAVADAKAHMTTSTTRRGVWANAAGGTAGCLPSLMSSPYPMREPEAEPIAASADGVVQVATLRHAPGWLQRIVSSGFGFAHGIRAAHQLGGSRPFRRRHLAQHGARRLRWSM